MANKEHTLPPVKPNGEPLKPGIHGQCQLLILLEQKSPIQGLLNSERRALLDLIPEEERNV